VRHFAVTTLQNGPVLSVLAAAHAFANVGAVKVNQCAVAVALSNVGCCASLAGVNHLFACLDARVQIVLFRHHGFPITVANPIIAQMKKIQRAVPGSVALTGR
jgi:hypothetical protein